MVRESKFGLCLTPNQSAVAFGYEFASRMTTRHSNPLIRLLEGNENGKPIARSGRKAMGLYEIARLPKCPIQVRHLLARGMLCSRCHPARVTVESSMRPSHVQPWQ